MVRYSFDILYPLYSSASSTSTHIGFSLTNPDPYLVALTCDGLTHQFGAGAAGSLIKYSSPQKATGIARVSRNHYGLVWTVLSYTRGRPIVVRVVKSSGTIGQV